MQFWEIIKLQFEKERHTLLCILKLFTDIIHELSLKNAWLPSEAKTMRGQKRFVNVIYIFCVSFSRICTFYFVQIVSHPFNICTLTLFIYQL